MRIGWGRSFLSRSIPCFADYSCKRGIKLKRKLIIIILLFSFVAMFVNKAHSQGVGITGGDVTLIISTATAGQEPDPVTDEVTGLRYYATAPRHKITVKTSLSSQKFTLTVEARNIVTGGDGGASGGTAQGVVTLNTTPQDFIRDIKKGTLAEPHTCTLKYTASATVSQGTGSDVHTITYTIVKQ